MHAEEDTGDLYHVVDSADLLSDEEEEDLEIRIQEIADIYEFDVVIVTENDIGGEDATAYADDFFDEKAPNDPSDLMGGGTLKTVGVQRVFSAPENISDTIKQEEIKKFNQYLDYALLEYYYYPDSYKEIDFCFEYFEGNVLTDSGNGWTLLVPASASDEETLRYICDNFTVYEYLRNITNVSEIKITVSEINTDYYCLSLSVPGTSSGEACDTPKTQESKPESEPVEEVVEEPTAETIADPSKAVNFIQATKSINMSIDKIASDVKAGKIQNNTPANINLGRYHSISKRF